MNNKEYRDFAYELITTKGLYTQYLLCRFGFNYTQILSQARL